MEEADAAGRTMAFPSQIVHEPHDERFIDAKSEDLKSLLEKGTYIIVSEQDVPSDAVILDSRFVLAIKHPEVEHPTFKARFVILGNKDPDKQRDVSGAPITLRTSLRITLSLAKM